MNTHSQVPSLTDLRNQVSACDTACTSAAQRAVDPHLQTRLGDLAGQVQAMMLRIGSYINSHAPVAASTVSLLKQQAVSATQGMKAAKGDDSLYQAMPPVQQLCSAIHQDLQALS
jgi:hypothetical protein